MAEFLELHFCFDDSGRQIEILAASRAGEDLYRIEETPLFNPDITLGDTIRVREERGVLYYIETVRRSGYIRMIRLLSREAAVSAELRGFQSRLASAGGRWEMIFGGVLVAYAPWDTAATAEAELSRILRRFGL